MRASFYADNHTGRDIRRLAMDSGTRALITNSRSFDHDSWRTGQNCGYSQLHRTACWRNGSSRRILERPKLFLNWAQQSFHEHRTPSDTSIATANRPTSSQARALPSRVGPRLRKLWHFHADAASFRALSRNPLRRGRIHAGGSFLPTPNALHGTPANLGGSCVYRQANSTS